MYLFVRFQAGDEAAFRALNEQWIKHYFENRGKGRSNVCRPAESHP